MSETFLSALHADPWVLSLIDLPELNERAGAAVEERVGCVRAAARANPQQLHSESLVLLGPPGTGKTHLFARVRRKLGPRAVFVHIRPLLHAGLTPLYVLGEAVGQLAQPSYGRGESQADALVGSLLGYLEGQGVDFPIAHLSAFREQSEAERGARLERMVDTLLELFPDLDDVFVERLLRLPFSAPRDRRALLAWLGGQDCDPSQLARIGAASSLDASKAIRALRTLGSVAALGAPLVLVFDQLENLIQRTETEERITQYGNLIAELVDATRGLSIVQMALDSEWEQGIQPRLNLSQSSRLVMSKSALALPTPAQSRALLELWCEQLDAPEQPFPWPFTRDQVERLCTLPSVTPRMLLSALKEAREGTTPSILAAETTSGAESVREASEEDLALPLAEAWSERLAAAHVYLDEAEARRAGADHGRLCDGILLAAGFAEGAALRGVSDPYIQLQPQAQEGRWLCFVHQGAPRSIAAALTRALERGASQAGVVVREQWRPLLPTWTATLERLVQVQRWPQLTWYELTREETAQLLALEALLQLARSRDLCDARGFPIAEPQVANYLRSAVQPDTWGVVVALRGGVTTHSAAPAEEEPNAIPPTAADDDGGRTSTGAHAPTSVASRLEAILLRLRVASVERVIREARRVEPSLGRSLVRGALKDLEPRVKWFGRDLVAWCESAVPTEASTRGEDK